MTALIFSLTLLAYIIIPGILFRRIFHLFVPLRRIQWSRTDELTAFVMTLLVPASIAFLLVHRASFFSQHPLAFPDSPTLKWSDYKDILIASYSEKFFDENRPAIVSAVERMCRRQGHFLLWYYVSTGLWSLLCAVAAYYYGNLRTSKWLVAQSIVFILEKFALPVISEWHAMFTPFTFPKSPERWVQLDALSTDGVLYQGEAGLFHIAGDGQLSGFFLKNAKRFMRQDFAEAKKQDQSVSKEKYWRQIPGESFYLPAERISNFNFTYTAKQSLDTLAEENLKKMKINATVMIQPATVALDAPQAAKAEQAWQAPKSVPAAQPTTRYPKFPLEVQKNFRVCPHCLVNHRPGIIPRVGADTALVSRSDGRSYHLYLQVGPRRQPSLSGGTVPGIFLAHFRYALDSQKITNEPVIVLIQANFKDSKVVNEIVEKIADKLADILEDGRKPAKFYKWDNRNKFTEMIPAS